MLRQGIGVRGSVELVAEGREATETDVENDTQRPDVDGASVATVAGIFEDFGGDIAGGSAEGGGKGFFSDDLGEAEVGEFDR